MMLDTAGVPRAEPAYFMADGRPCLRWLHRTAEMVGAHDVGVVICNPFGYEAICAHRSLRHLAEQCAAIGFPALRFDYEGTGDSAGDDLAPGRWEAWLASVRAASRELRETTGVSRVVLLGVRLGATIAVSAAVDDPTVAGAVLIAPIVNGRTWLRELRALRGTMGRAAGPPEFALPDDVLESAGLLIAGDTRAALESIDLATFSGSMPPDLLLIDRTDRPPNEALVDRWREEGRGVRHSVLPGYLEMMADPHESQVPSAFIAEVVSWLEATFPSRRSRTDVQLPHSPDDGGLLAALVADGIEERVHWLDDNRRLFGVSTIPVGSHPTRALVLLNSGANHHIGYGRMYVNIARRLAAAGWVVLRYDVSGIGESRPHDGAPECTVYTPHAVEDFGAVLAYLGRAYAPQHIEAMGVCSGAYHALKGAAAGLPVHGVTVINPLVFFWKQGTSLAYPAYEMVKAVSEYKRSILRADKWLKAIRGGVDVREFAMVMTNRLGDRARRSGRELLRTLGAQVEDDLAAELSGIVRRGVRLRFVFSVGEPGEALLRAGAGRTLTKLQATGALSISHLANCDHSLTSTWMQEFAWSQLYPTLDE
jgi:alpha-beta hydrolase superfamily lysophospholipase